MMVVMVAVVMIMVMMVMMVVVMMMIAQVPEAAQQMKKFEARVTKLRQTPGLDADPDVGQDDGDDCDDDDK